MHLKRAYVMFARVAMLLQSASAESKSISISLNIGYLSALPNTVTKLSVGPVIKEVPVSATILHPPSQSP